MPLDLQDMLNRRKSCTVQYLGEDVTFEFWTEKLTQSTATEFLRLARVSARLEQRASRVFKDITEPTGDPDSEEAEDADAEANAYLDRVKAEGRDLKQKLSELLAEVLAEWDLLLKGEPYPITVENLNRLDDGLLSEFVAAMLKGGQELGEAKGRRNTRPSPSTSRRKASPGKTLHRRTG